MPLSNAKHSRTPLKIKQERSQSLTRAQFASSVSCCPPQADQHLITLTEQTLKQVQGDPSSEIMNGSQLIN